jgi:hypothetical protein
MENLSPLPFKTFEALDNVESWHLPLNHPSMNKSMLITIDIFRERNARADDTERHHRSGMVMISCRYAHDMLGKPVRNTTL